MALVFGHRWFYAQALEQCLPHGTCSVTLLDGRMKGNTPVWTVHRILGRNQTSLRGSEEKVFRDPIPLWPGLWPGEATGTSSGSVCSWPMASDKADVQH